MRLPVGGPAYLLLDLVWPRGIDPADVESLEQPRSQDCRAGCNDSERREGPSVLAQEARRPPANPHRRCRFPRRP